jgi:PIN domain nuclease of toxin-antitoxin system
VTALVLDAEALNALATGTRGEGRVRAALSAAVNQSVTVVVPAVVLAELYRGGSHDQRVDSCLARQGGIEVADTDRSVARQVGHLLVAAGLGSAHLADAHTVAAAISHGGGVVLTGDVADIEQLAAPHGAVTVAAVQPRRSRRRRS